MSPIVALWGFIDKNIDKSQKSKQFKNYLTGMKLRCKGIITPNNGAKACQNFFVLGDGEPQCTCFFGYQKSSTIGFRDGPLAIHQLISETSRCQNHILRI